MVCKFAINIYNPIYNTGVSIRDEKNQTFKEIKVKFKIEKIMDMLSELGKLLMDGLHNLPADEAGILCSLDSNKRHIEIVRIE